MTDTDHDRLIILETKFDNQALVLSDIRADLAEIKKAAHMGRGAWAVILRLGAFTAALLTAFAWLYNNYWLHK